MCASFNHESRFCVGCGFGVVTLCPVVNVIVCEKLLYGAVILD